uniref:Granule-bound starch synthase n=1 Tax=Cyanophora paradoxa TaxID=2762 RepID=A8V967_CYAPA|nr:granule-bound starch synthase [Cyanophora paradoxa]
MNIAPVSELQAAIDQAEKKLTIVFVGSECTPWSKTGGLGDVMRDLPVNLAQRGHRVMSIQPRYDQYFDAWDTAVRSSIKVNGKLEDVGFFHITSKGVDRIFIDHPWFLAKVWGITGNKLYGAKTGVDYPDNPMRFALMCQAALEAPLRIPLPDPAGTVYGEDVIFVCNDWHSALVPIYLKANYKTRGLYQNAKSIFLLHNIIYQGRFPLEFWPALNLPEAAKKDLVFESCFAPPPLDGISEQPIISLKPMAMMNFLQAGFIHADRICTVSPQFAAEVASGPRGGVELDKYIRAKGITGIMNGMDIEMWDASKDKFLVTKYTASSVDEGKAANKAVLQAEMGLKVSPTTPLIAFVGRLDDQKGADCMVEAMPYLVNTLGAQVVCYGSGREDMAAKFKALEKQFPGMAKGKTAFVPKEEHTLMAGADYVLMPSRFEPCGLVQLHAMKYGAVPIVSCTGGLKDSVIPECGFTFEEIPSPEYPGMKISPELIAKGTKIIEEGCKEALAGYGSKAFAGMRAACMKQDFAWKKRVLVYEKVFYETLGIDRGAPVTAKASPVAPEPSAAPAPATISAATSGGILPVPKAAAPKAPKVGA